MNNIQKLLNSPEIQEKLHIKTKDLKLNEQQKHLLGSLTEDELLVLYRALY